MLEATKKKKKISPMRDCRSTPSASQVLQSSKSKFQGKRKIKEHLEKRSGEMLLLFYWT